MKIHLGGEDHLTCELATDMSLAANLRAIRIGQALRAREVEGLLECYPTNISLMLRFDTDVHRPEDLVALVEEVADEIDRTASPVLRTRVIEIATWYDDPVTRACQERFAASRHDPDVDDLTFCARVNGLSGKEEMIERFSGSPWVVSASGFYPGSMESVQLVEPARQLTTPKYLTPRLSTPTGTVGQAGCFGGIYPYESAGGYQMMGRTPGPVYQAEGTLSDFAESPTLFRAGDVLVFWPIDEQEFGAVESRVADGSFRHRIAEVEFGIDELVGSPASASQRALASIGR